MTEHAGRRLLRHLRRRGVESLYLTAGSDFAPLVHAYTQGAEGLPEPVPCLEETVAIGMAHGRALATGQPQVAMVHVTVGTAKALCGLINAAHDRTPLVLMAGRNPVTQQGQRGSRSMYIHWAQEMFDQGGMLREFVKWDYEVRDPSQVEEAIDRALAIAMAEPRGPVYLTLPREMLASEVPAPEVAAQLAVPTPAAPDPQALAQLAEWIAAARCPMVLAADVGLQAGDRDALATFADAAAVGVIEANRAFTSNLDPAHPRHLGFDVALALEQADLLLVCGAAVPWIPDQQRPQAGCRVVHLGIDPLFSRIPFRAFPADMHLACGYAPVFRALAQATGGRAARDAHLQRLRATREQAVAAKRERVLASNTITRSFASAALNAALPAEAVVVNEYWLDRDLVDTRTHGSYFYQSPAGGLGWGVPAALGVQRAWPQRRVVATVGDGSYVFANPTACHQAAAAQRLPILIAIYNNRRWGAVENAAQQVYPELRAGQPEALPLADLGPLPDYAAYARASGGHGETVTQAGELAPALQRCFAAMAEGRHALIDIHGT
ncbi:MAG TPA: thiamine pyrophosphate-requiring protein [Ramlibacter sp.]|nr:thiamine pyrophosphate-requiring protein [Ramlibacter sp.]